MLGTRDAHTLYEKSGWTRIAPDDTRWMERADPAVYRRLAEEASSGDLARSPVLLSAAIAESPSEAESCGDSESAPTPASRATTGPICEICVICG